MIPHSQSLNLAGDAEPAASHVEAWRQSLAAALPAGALAVDEPTLARYARSSSGRGTTPLAVAQPESTEQVQALVQAAARHRLPLYPISRGRNWGYGDACASQPGCVIVDLSRMNRILEVDRELGYAVIQPGVTQGQLYEHLRAHAPELWPDCTGAGLEASLVGNTLDRGFGHTPYGDHAAHTCGMEVVLADGSVLHTGMGHFANSRTAHVYPYGVGPSLDGLFGQSNFGIVTRVGLWLMPAPEAFCAFFVQPRADSDMPLQDLIDRLAPLRRRGLLTSTVHVGNDLRVLSGRIRYPWDRTEGRTPLPQDVRDALCAEQSIAPWNAAGGIYGTRGTVRAVRREVKRALRGCRVTFIDDRKLALAEAIHAALSRVGLGSGLGEKLGWLKPVYGLMKGVPTDEPLLGAQWRVREPAPEGELDPLQSPAGLMWLSPVLPNESGAAARVMDILEPIFQDHGFELPMTFTMINERAMIGVSNIAFDRRDDDEVRRAHACYEEACDQLLAQGFAPYRAGPTGQAKLAGTGSVFWQTVGRLKQALDPDNLISPGRYAPPVAGGAAEHDHTYPARAG